MSFLSQPIQSILVKPKRQVGDITLNVVITESATDKLTITKQPVQQGASITDHAFKEPTQLSMTAYFANNLTTSLSKIYQNLLDLQNSRIPFDVVTPKRIYHNMLMGVLGQTTDKTTENCLAINFSFEEIIIVTIGTNKVSRTSQRNPGKTGATQDTGKKSALLTGINAITKAFQ